MEDAENAPRKMTSGAHPLTVASTEFLSEAGRSREENL